MLNPTLKAVLMVVIPVIILFGSAIQAQSKFKAKEAASVEGCTNLGKPLSLQLIHWDCNGVKVFTRYYTGK